MENDELLSISVWMPGVAIIMHRRKELFVKNATITLTLLLANNTNKSPFYWRINLRDKEENLAEQSQKTIPNIDYVSHCKHCTNGHSLETKERPVYKSKRSHKGAKALVDLVSLIIWYLILDVLKARQARASVRIQ